MDEDGGSGQAARKSPRKRPPQRRLLQEWGPRRFGRNRGRQEQKHLVKSAASNASPSLYRACAGEVAARIAAGEGGQSGRWPSLFHPRTVANTGLCPVTLRPIPEQAHPGTAPPVCPDFGHGSGQCPDNRRTQRGKVRGAVAAGDWRELCKPARGCPSPNPGVAASTGLPRRRSTSAHPAMPRGRWAQATAAGSRKRLCSIK